MFQQTRYRNFSAKTLGAALAILALLAGSCGLLGWLLKIEFLKSLLSDGASMKVNTAILLIFLALSFLFYRIQAIYLTRITAGLVVLLSLALLIEQLFKLDLGIDQFWFKDTVTDAMKEAPGRTSLLTALSALFLGVALWLLVIRQFRAAQLFAVCVLVIIYVSFIGHLFHISGFYCLGKYSGVAFHTAIGLLGISAAIIFDSFEKGWVNVVYVHAKKNNRSIFYVVYLIGASPLLATFYLFVTQYTGLDAASKTIVLITLTAILCLPLAYFFLKLISQLENKLTETDNKLQIALDAAMLGSYGLDMETGSMSCTLQCKLNFGLKSDDTFNFPDLLNSIVPEHRQAVKQSVQKALSEASVYNSEYQVTWPDGTLHWISASGKPIPDESGRMTRIVGVTIDITAQVESKRDLENAFAETQSLNEELAASNEEIAASNEELTAINEELIEVQGLLQQETDQKQVTLDHLNVSEQNLRNMVRQAPVGMCIVEGDPLYMTEMNDSFLEIIGRTELQAKSKPYWEVIPEAKDFYKPITDEVLATGKTYHAYEHEIMLVRNGVPETVYIDFVYEPMISQEGKAHAIMIVAIDVTDKVLSRRKVERAEESLRMAVDAAGLGTYFINATDRIFYPSARLKEFFGFKPDEEVPYEAAINQIREDYRQQAADMVERAFTTGERFDLEYPVIGHRDGSTRWVRGIGTMQHYDGKDFFTGVLHDITESKADEIRKNDFIGMVSHELKTPLTSLSALIQVTQSKLKNSEDPFLAGAMEKSNVQVNRMKTMINGFLNISRLESGKILIQKETFELETLITEMVNEARLTISTHIINFDGCDNLMVFADRDKIGSVISNLISNAVKYSPKGKIVGIKCSKNDKEVIVSVSDEGMGIKQEDLEKIFDRYYRVETSHTQHISGFGIGLYLSSEIIQRHDGRVWAESQMGQGSTFHFSLPA